MYFYIWEIFVCFVEALLVTYLLYKKIGLKSNQKWRFLLSVALITAASGILSILNISVFQRMTSLFFVCVLVAIWGFHAIQNGNWYKAILWPSCYLVIVTAADSIAFSIADLMVDYPLEDLMTLGNARFQFTLIYLLIATALVWAIAHLGEPEPAFPWQVSVILFVLLSVGIFAAESIIDITLVLGINPATAGYTKTLSALSYSILLMLFAMLVTFEWLGVILKRNRHLRQKYQLAMIEQRQYELMVSASESLTEWKHDYHGQLRLIAALIDQEKYAELKQFSADLDSALPASAHLISSGNPTVDAVISLRMMDAKRNHIHFETKLFLPECVPLNDVAFASLIGNLLDNAVEACRKLPIGTGKICFEIKPWNQMMYIFCSNTSDGNYSSKSSGNLLSTKKAKGHGIGIRRICELVDQAGGTFQFTPEESCFKVSIMIPLEVISI